MKIFNKWFLVTKKHKQNFVFWICYFFLRVLFYYIFKARIYLSMNLSTININNSKEIKYEDIDNEERQ